MISVISKGSAACIKEPRGDHGLDGYRHGIEYNFERRENELGEYITIFSGGAELYETCSEWIFKFYFSITLEHSVS